MPSGVEPSSSDLLAEERQRSGSNRRAAETSSRFVQIGQLQRRVHLSSSHNRIRVDQPSSGVGERRRADIHRRHGLL